MKEEHVELEKDVEMLFMGSLSTLDSCKAWHGTVTIAGLPFSFKLDTGSEANTIPACSG